MFVRDLPPEKKKKLRTLVEPTGERWEVIENLSINEAADWMKAREEDCLAQLERKRRRLALGQELNDLARSVSEQYPDLPMGKVEYFLHGEVRARGSRRCYANWKKSQECLS